jgi:hypothetical protein
MSDDYKTFAFNADARNLLSPQVVDDLGLLSHRKTAFSPCLGAPYSLAGRKFRSAKSLLKEIVEFLNYSSEGRSMWQILTALRGPDNNSDEIKEKTTQRFRHQLGIQSRNGGGALTSEQPIDLVAPLDTSNVFSSLQGQTDYLKDRLPVDVQWHFMQHFIQGVNALRSLGDLNEVTPAIGQVWQSRDRRNKERQVTITSIEGAYAFVTPPGRIRLDRFKPTSNGFDRVLEVPQAAAPVQVPAQVRDFVDMVNKLAADTDAFGRQ